MPYPTTTQSLSTPLQNMAISSLTPELLLSIFMRIDSKHIVLSRRVSKEWLAIIDSNRNLWNIFDWEQKHEDQSFGSPLDLFNQTSGKTLKKVSIQLQRNVKMTKDDQKQLYQVIEDSKTTLTSLSLKVSDSAQSQKALISEVIKAPNMREIIFWNPTQLSHLPYSRISLLGSGSSSHSDDEQSKLKIFWISDSQVPATGYDLIKKHSPQFSSLVSFANDRTYRPDSLVKVLSHFSDTLVHLKVDISSSIYVRDPNLASLTLPSLRVIEGEFSGGFPSFKCPILKVAIIKNMKHLEAFLVPSTVEELWLTGIETFKSFEMDSGDAEDRVEMEMKFSEETINLKILKVTESCFTKADGSRGPTSDVLYSLKGLCSPRDDDYYDWEDKYIINEAGEYEPLQQKFFNVKRLILPPGKYNLPLLKELKKVVGRKFEALDEVFEVKC